MAESGEHLTSHLMPTVLGLITDSILDSIMEMDLVKRPLIITVMGAIYAVLYVKRKKSKGKYEQKKLGVSVKEKPESKGISRNVTAVMIIGFIIAIILVFIASAIRGLTIVSIALMMVWLIVMVIFVLSGNFTSVNTAYFLRSIAAVGLGGALSIGSVPTYEFFAADPVELTIQNHCPDSIVYEMLGIEVPGNTVKTVELEPLTVIFRRDENYVYVYAFCQTVPYKVPEDAFVSFNEVEIKPGDSLKVDLSEQEEHELFIQCVP
ncbi:MAG: hypothetical protein HXS54_07285 [Theionarchaea archaeon]|nr:hypothetical protein [Theionarchaea archaeon]